MSARPLQRDVLAELLREVIVEVRGLRQDLDDLRGRLTTPRGLGDRERSVLHAVRDVVGERAFSAREVLAHAELANGATLRAALAAADVSSTKVLGKLLRKAARLGDLGGFSLERLGTDRLGAIWRVCEFALPQIATPMHVPDHRTHRLR